MSHRAMLRGLSGGIVQSSNENSPVSSRAEVLGVVGGTGTVAADAVTAAAATGGSWSDASCRVLVDGAPLVGCSVRAKAGDGGLLQLVPPLGDDGRFELRGLPPGPLLLAVRAWQRPYPVHEEPVDVEPGTVLEIETGVVDIDLAQQGAR